MAAEYHINTVAELSEFIQATQGTIRRWIKTGKLEAARTPNGYVVPFSPENLEFVLAERKKRYTTEPVPYNPVELTEYSEWHEILDELTWLFKVSYDPANFVKSKLFRTEIIFMNYMRAHNVTLKRVKGIFASSQPPDPVKVADDLKRGWYNELSYALPLKKSTLGVGFKDININKDVSNIRFAFPSWKVIEAYYSTYFYLRSMTLQKFSGFRLAEHGATILSFKNSLLNPLSKVIWKFPLDISYSPKEKVYRNKLYLNQVEHLRFKYSAHPRYPHHTPMELFEHIHGTFKKKSRVAKRPTTYTLFDFLHDFRIWANYQNIDDLLSLWGTGYKAFMDQNLSLLLFFIGGIAEICYIAVFGAEKYLENLQNLYDLFAVNNVQLEDDFPITPLYQRCEIYKELGFIDREITLKGEPKTNTLIFIVD